MISIWRLKESSCHPRYYLVRKYKKTCAQHCSSEHNWHIHTGKCKWTWHYHCLYFTMRLIANGCRDKPKNSRIKKYVSDDNTVKSVCYIKLMPIKIPMWTYETMLWLRKLKSKDVLCSLDQVALRPVSQQSQNPTTQKCEVSGRLWHDCSISHR